MRFSLATILALSTSFANATVFNGAKIVSQLQNDAVLFKEKSYYVQSESSGDFMQFDRHDGNAGISLKSSRATVTVSTFSVSSKYADEQSPAGTKGIVISEEDCDDNCKCLSSQWVVQEGIHADIHAAAYSCAIGPNPVKGRAPIHTGKQIYWAVEAGKVSSSTSIGVELAAKKAAVKSTPKKSTPKKSTKKTTKSTCNPSKSCCKDSGWLCRHPNYVKDHKQCASKLKAGKCSAHRLARRSHSELAKRRTLAERDTIFTERDIISYRLHVVDHSLDQTPRCVAAKNVRAFGNADGLVIEPCDDSDDGQLWTFTPA